MEKVSKIKEKNGIIWRKAEGKAVILDAKKSCYFHLNETGTLIWEGLLEGKSIEQISKSVADEYNVSKKLAAGHINDLIGQLKKSNLINIK